MLQGMDAEGNALALLLWFTGEFGTGIAGCTWPPIASFGCSAGTIEDCSSKTKGQASDVRVAGLNSLAD